MAFLPLIVHWLWPRGGETLSGPQALKVADALAGRYRPLVSLGEGFLARPDRAAILLRLDERGFQFEAAASRVEADVAWELAEARIDTVVVPLFGTAAAHERRAGPGSFERLQATLGALNEASLRTRLDFAADSSGAVEAEEVYRWAAGAGADALRVCPVVRPARASREPASEGMDARGWEELLEWYERRSRSGDLSLELEPAPHGPPGGRLPPGPRPLTLRDLWGPDQRTKAIHLDFRRLTVTREFSQGGRGREQLRRPGPLGGCSGGRFEAFISPRGELFACPHRPKIAGSLLESTFAELWDGAPAFAEARQEAAGCPICERLGWCCACGAAPIYRPEALEG